MRSANVFFLIFDWVSQLGGANMPPRDVSYLFEGVGAWFPVKFPSNSSCSHHYLIKILLFSSSSQKFPIKFLLFPSSFKQIHFIPSSSHQIPLVPINHPSMSICSHQVPKKFPWKFPSITFCSHQVPKQFSSNSSCSHQYPFVLIEFPNNSHQIPLVPIKFLFVPMAMEDRQVSTKVNGETRARLGQSAKRSAIIRGQAGRVSHSGRQTSARCGRAETRDFPPASFCGRSRADPLLAPRFSRKREEARSSAFFTGEISPKSEIQN